MAQPATALKNWNLSERDTALLSLDLSLDEFSRLVEVTYDDRWERRHNWRVQGDEKVLHGWINDLWQSKEEEMFTDDQIIKQTYDLFRSIQARKGQLNFNAVYMRDRENIEIVERNKKFDYATVNIVRDCIDKNWRWAIEYSVSNGGCLYPLGYEDNIVYSREEAVMSGVKFLIGDISESYEFKGAESSHISFVNKIQKFLDQYRASIIQPSLF